MLLVSFTMRFKCFRHNDKVTIGNKTNICSVIVGTDTRPHGTTDTPNPEIHRASFPKWRMDQGLHGRFSH